MLVMISQVVGDKCICTFVWQWFYVITRECKLLSPNVGLYAVIYYVSENQYIQKQEWQGKWGEQWQVINKYMAKK